MIPILGIDPGASGALTVIKDSEVILAKKAPKDPNERSDIIRKIHSFYPDIEAAIEWAPLGFHRQRPKLKDLPEPMEKSLFGTIKFALEKDMFEELEDPIVFCKDSIQRLLTEIDRMNRLQSEDTFTPSSAIGKLNKDEGIWIGILSAFNIKCTEYTAQSWGKYLKNYPGATLKERVKKYTADRFKDYVWGPRKGFQQGIGDSIVIALNHEAFLKQELLIANAKA